MIKKLLHSLRTRLRGITGNNHTQGEGNMRRRKHSGLKVLVILVASLAIFVGVVFAAAPAGLPGSYAFTVSDCNGPTENARFDSSDPVYESLTTNPVTGTPCQSFALDIYENLQYTAQSGNDDTAGCADIVNFSGVSDSTWLYAEWEMYGAGGGAGGGDCFNVNSSHHYALEIDNDAITDLRGDWVVYGVSNGCGDGSWTDMGGISVELWEDSNNDLGADDSTQGETCTLPIQGTPRPLSKSDLGDGKTYEDGPDAGSAPDDGCSNRNPAEGSSDSYDNGGSIPSDTAYCRWDGVNFHLAIRLSAVGLTSSSPNVRLKPWSDMSTSFSKDSFPEHDHRDPDFLGGARRDNLDWHTGADPTAIELVTLGSKSSTGGLADSPLIVFGLLGAGALLLFALARRRRKA